MIPDDIANEISRGLKVMLADAACTTTVVDVVGGGDTHCAALLEPADAEDKLHVCCKDRVATLYGTEQPEILCPSPNNQKVYTKPHTYKSLTPPQRH